MTTALGSAARANRELRRAREERARLAVSEERLRIARDLHDLLGQTLTLVTLKTELATRLLHSDPRRAEAELREVQRVTREALADTRGAVQGYRRLPFADALERAVETLAAAGIDCRVDAVASGLPDEVDSVLAWAVREATTNVVRHSNARTCAITLSNDPNGVALQIEDDGADGGARRRRRFWPDGARGARAQPGRDTRRRGAAGGRVSPPPDIAGPSEMIRVLIAEDQGMVRGALASLLALEEDIEVVAEVERGDQVVTAARAQGVDIALLDIEMPGLDGISAAADLARELPGVKTLILTTFGRPGYLRRAIESGVSGFLLKDAPAEQLASAIREVNAGGRVIDSGLSAATIADGVSPLTKRERDVLAAAAGHATAAEIAGTLYLSEGTVRNYLSAAMQKLGARNRAEAVAIARDKGWL